MVTQSGDFAAPGELRKIQGRKFAASERRSGKEPDRDTNLTLNVRHEYDGTGLQQIGLMDWPVPFTDVQDRIGFVLS